MLPGEAEQIKRATNPNTPISDLVELLLDFPGEVLRNPPFQVAVVADRTVGGPEGHRQSNPS